MRLLGEDSLRPQKEKERESKKTKGLYAYKNTASPLDLPNWSGLGVQVKRGPRKLFGGTNAMHLPRISINKLCNHMVSGQSTPVTIFDKRLYKGSGERNTFLFIKKAPSKLSLI
jgi:hypothetical protein